MADKQFHQANNKWDITKDKMKERKKERKKRNEMKNIQSLGNGQNKLW